MIHVHAVNEATSTWFNVLIAITLSSLLSLVGYYFFKGDDE